MSKKTLSVILAAFAATFILTAGNSFAFPSIGSAVDSYCAPRGVQPYGGNCDLCHANNTNFSHARSGDYDWFCPLPTCTDNDGDTYAVEGGTCGPVDCDDTDAAVNPGAAENCTDGFDNNCNGLVDAQDPAAVGCLVCTDNDGDTYAIEGGACGPVDCDDADASVNPAGVETCGDAIDNNCNGAVDENCGPVCTDSDGDTYAIEGGACGPVDCDDADASVNPGAAEVCDDAIDNNCDGAADENCGPFCTDSDGDTYAIEGGACGPVDCDDTDASVNPGAAELCDDATDNNCNGAADENCGPVCTDSDGDTYAIEGGACGPVDCDDTDDAVNPGAVENCTDGLDNNCNGLVDALDPNAANCPAACTDNDGDTYAVEGGECGPVDCDDTDAGVNPGTAEFCDDAIDNDCDGSVDEGCEVSCPDVDGDGFTDAACGGNDCDDNDAAINPGAQESCGNGLDENCNGSRDDECLTCPDGGVLSIKEAEYNRGDGKLVAKGRSHIGTSITLTNADTGEILAENIPVRGGKWRVEVKNLHTDLARIAAVNSDGCTAEFALKVEGRSDDHEDDDDESESDGSSRTWWSRR